MTGVGCIVYIRDKPVADVISQEDIYALGQRIYDPQLKGLYYILYLTGARITEALKLKRKDVSWGSPQEKKTLVFDLITLKNKRQKHRKIPVVLNTKYEKEMAGEVIEYVNRFEKGDSPLFKIERTNATHRLQRMLKIYVRAVKDGKTEVIEEYPFRIHPHYLRHCRLTHLVEMYGIDAVSLKNFAGWTGLDMADTYIRQDWKGLAKRMGG